MEHERTFLAAEHIDTIYIGGGTPSVCSPEQIQLLIETVKRLWDCTKVSEITMEANPDDLTSEYLRHLSLSDINRLSIGIQSFNDSDLKLMNRRHAAQDAIDAVRCAQTFGFDNITIDLIYGVPGSSTQIWSDNIDTALSLGIQHISAYHLSIEPGSRFGRMATLGQIEPVPEEVSQQQYIMLHDRLVEHGFDHYEISNFALAGFHAIHNSSYWNGEPYLGIGPSAHSYNGTLRRWSIPSVVKYVDHIDYESETLTPDDEYNEFIMTRLRTSKGLSKASIEQRFGVQKRQYFCEMVEKFLSKGLLTEANDYISIPYQHYLIADAIICELFENS